MSNTKGSKFKVGDKVVPFPTEYGYLISYLVAGSTYTVTKIYENGRVDVEGTFKNDGHGNNWDSDWFKPYEEKEVKVENTMTAESLRNSILSLQQERVSLQEKIEQNIAQEKALTEQLKGLGFLLIKREEQSTNVVDETKTALYAEYIEEDMTDPHNWKVGDLILCVDADGWRGWIDEGEIAEMVEEFTTLLTLKTKYGVHRFSSSYCEDFKFHSRPITN